MKTITEPQDTQNSDKKIQISTLRRDLGAWIAKRIPKACKNERMNRPFSARHRVKEIV